MSDKKEAAEHATIVDLIRNDLSRVAEHVRVDKYRYIDVLHTNKGNILQTSSENKRQVTNRLSKAHRKHIGCNVARRFHNRCAKGQDYGNNPRSGRL